MELKMPENHEFAALVRLLSMSLPDTGHNRDIQILRLLRHMFCTKPGRFHALRTLAPNIDKKACMKTCNWLAAENILNMVNGSAQLTGAGRRALITAADSNKPLCEFLQGRREDLARAETNQALMSILRAHIIELGYGQASPPVISPHRPSASRRPD
jgi:hypothetical protein